jgi:hypothetical protein
MWGGELVWWAIVILSILGYLLLLGTISPLITFTIITLVSLIGLIVDTLFIEPISWAMVRPSLDRWVKVLSVTLIIVGFHFDLLAS